MRGWLMQCGVGVVCLACFAVPLAGATGQQTQSTSTAAQAATSERAVIDRYYCVTCHNARLETGGLSLETVDLANVAARAVAWEQEVRKLCAGAMPPKPRPRPDRVTYADLLTYLETALDRAVAADPGGGGGPASRPVISPFTTNRCYVGDGMGPTRGLPSS